MGGGLSLTFPGYHIFAAEIMQITGLNVLCGAGRDSVLVFFVNSFLRFLVTKKVWNESAAFIVAFLAAVSSFDVEMLMWGRYPDVITLLLIPLTFYLFLQRERFTITPFVIIRLHSWWLQFF